MKKIAIGCDPNAAGLKEAIIKHLAELGYECEDYGSDDPIYANVAIDVARCAVRLGAAEVNIVYRRTRDEMPAWEEEIAAAEAEGTVLTYLSAPQEILVEDGRVVGLRCIRMRLTEPDSSGRKRPVPIPDSEYEIEIDQLVPAIGQRPDLSAIEDVTGLTFSRWGTAEVDAVTYATNREGVFAGGDLQTGPWIAIGAIAAAIMALVHDVTLTLGVFALLNLEISLQIIAAFLTIIGYSLNDTIVVFDRIRENMKLRRRESYAEVINRSINETLSRTLVTSLTTLIAVGMLLVLGGGAINDFALALCIGVVVGTYSSIFVATPVVLLWHRDRKPDLGGKTTAK